MKPRLLDLFCGAGGAAMGYARAGFEVVGVDVEPQPHYPFQFECADALDWLRADARSPGFLSRQGFDAIHASPPCQSYIRGGLAGKGHPDLLGRTRTLLEATGLPYVIENVPGAPMRPDVMLCGSMFGLGIRRHRWFETSPPLPPWTLACNHSAPVTGVYGNPHGKAGAWQGKKPMLPSDHATWSREMGIDWMTSAELSQAIPPAYTEWVGRHLIQAIERSAA